MSDIAALLASKRADEFMSKDVVALRNAYESLQSQLAAANERADRYKEFWEATLLDCREAGERADVKAAAHSDMAEMYRKEKERADGLQRIVDEARAQKPAATIVEIDDGLGTTFLEFNEPRGPAGTNYYAAPVPAQPAVVPEIFPGTTDALAKLSIKPEE